MINDEYEKQTTLLNRSMEFRWRCVGVGAHAFAFLGSRGRQLSFLCPAFTIPELPEISERLHLTSVALFSAILLLHRPLPPFIAPLSGKRPEFLCIPIKPLKMGLTEIRSAMKVDLKKPADQQIGLHVSQCLAARTLHDR